LKEKVVKSGGEGWEGQKGLSR
jgi:hypothetical protein